MPEFDDTIYTSKDVLATNAEFDNIKSTGIVTATTYHGDGSALTGISKTRATGGGSDEIFYENDQTVTTDYTLTAGKNAMSAGPITINSSVTITVPAGAAWTVV